MHAMMISIIYDNFQTFAFVYAHAKKCVRMIVIMIFIMEGGYPYFILMLVMPARFSCFMSKECI